MQNAIILHANKIGDGKGEQATSNAMIKIECEIKVD